MGFRVWDLRFRVRGLGLGFGVLGPRSIRKLNPKPYKPAYFGSWRIGRSPGCEHLGVFGRSRSNMLRLASVALP